MRDLFIMVRLSDCGTQGGALADEQTFETLLSEFRRVGVDPDTFSAMLALRPEDALRAMRALPDGVGPAAFLAQLRKNGITPPASAGPSASAAGKADSILPDRDQRRRDKSA
jgi:hypothetical protein